VDEILRSAVATYPVAASFIACAVYAILTSLPVPLAAFLSLLCGWFFGNYLGTGIVSFGAVGGAILTLLYSRYLLRRWALQRFGSLLETVDSKMNREGLAYLLGMRLMPGLPFFAVNAAFGLTSIRIVPFWIVSQIGMLPASIAYVYVGSTIPTLEVLKSQGARGVLNWQFTLGMAILAMLPIVLKYYYDRFHQPSPIDRHT